MTLAHVVLAQRCRRQHRHRCAGGSPRIVPQFLHGEDGYWPSSMLAARATTTGAHAFGSSDSRRGRERQAGGYA